MKHNPFGFFCRFNWFLYGHFVLDAPVVKCICLHIFRISILPITWWRFFWGCRSLKVYGELNGRVWKWRWTSNAARITATTWGKCTGFELAVVECWPMKIKNSLLVMQILVISFINQDEIYVYLSYINIYRL